MGMRPMKTIKRLILLAILLAGVAIYFAFTSGGKNFRWLGHKTEKVGDTIRDTLERAADSADELKKAKDKSLDGLKRLDRLKDELVEDGEKK